ncbi:MAG: IclR family transcriptional regulator [Pseudomonadota bacterium]
MSGEDAQGVQSVEVAGTVLTALQSLGGSASLGEIAQAADLHRGKIHRYLTSLARSGLVHQNSDSGHYELGPLALSLGLTALRRQNPIALATRALSRLRDATDQTATLAVWGQKGPVVVALEQSRRPVSMNVRIGTELPAETTALGHVFLGQGNALYSAIQGDLLPGIAACAAPIFGYDGALLMAAGVVGRTEDFSPLAPLANAVTDFTQSISQSLGHAPSCSE